MAVGLPWNWGTTAADVERAYPADTVLAGPVVLATRAIHVDAPVETTWRWVCQLAVAPYSYDWIDNFGRSSPRELTPGADALVVGQTAIIFELTDVQPGRQWTGRTVPRAERAFGPVALTYAVEPEGTGSRLVCRLACRNGNLLSRIRLRALAWGDLVMMRKQFLKLKELAERDARRAQAQPGRPQ